MTIKNGQFDILTGDDAIHGDNELVIDEGVFNITKCYEGLEASKITINGGDILINASDDGINASDGTSTNQPGNANPNCILTINDGNLDITSNGDSLDSNGDLIVNGGTLFLYGPSNTPDEALDADGDIIINGGIVFGSGPSSLMETPSNKSTQKTLVIYFTSALSINSVISIKDNNDQEIHSYTVKKTMTSLVVSSPTINSQQSIKIYQGTSLFKSGNLTPVITTFGTSSGGGGGGGGRG